MPVNRNGKAKFLKHHEMERLVEYGLITARDKCLFTLLYYTSIRISEAINLPYANVFSGNSVRDEIVIPKEITKGRAGTRTIPTHPDLGKFCQRYREDSLKLLKVKEEHGDWSHLNLSPDGKIYASRGICCPKCRSFKVTKQGKTNGEAWYRCKSCKKYFRGSQLQTLQKQDENDSVYDPLGVTCSMNYGFLFKNPDNPYLFPGRHGQGHLSRRGALGILEDALKRVHISGASSHSGRRTSLSEMHAKGIPIRVLQEISGHSDLASLQKYLEVSDEELEEAINIL